MYGLSEVSVSGGESLGDFDIGAIFKSVADVGLNIYKQNVAVQVAKAQPVGFNSNPYGYPSSAVPTTLPYVPGMTPYPNVPQYGYPVQSGMSTGTMLMLGLAGVLGVALIMKSRAA